MSDLRFEGPFTDTGALRLAAGVNLRIPGDIGIIEVIERMSHTKELSHLGSFGAPSAYSGAVSGLLYGDASRRIAVLPDTFGMTSFYRGFSAFLSGQGATVFLVNPWEPFGELPEDTREAADQRRQKLRDRAFCDDLWKFVRQERIDAIVGFCIGGNFLFELALRGYDGTCIACSPMPWGMANDDALQAAFDYMPTLDKDVTILMGDEDHLAGPDRIGRLREVCEQNPALDLHVYEKSGHGFLEDLESQDSTLQENAREALQVLASKVFPEPRATRSG